MTLPREQRRCPVCGDPSEFVLWIEDEPPMGCADDPVALAGGPRTIRNVTECPRQMHQARRAALWRKLFPAQFDGHGNIVPGGLAHILANWPAGVEWLP
jgi:hypothetical protein